MNSVAVLPTNAHLKGFLGSKDGKKLMVENYPIPGFQKMETAREQGGRRLQDIRAGNKDGLGSIEDDMIVDIAINEAWGVKHRRTDGMIVIEGERKEEYSEPSKDIVARVDKDRKTDNMEAKYNKLKNA